MKWPTETNNVVQLLRDKRNKAVELFAKADYVIDNLDRFEQGTRGAVSFIVDPPPLEKKPKTKHPLRVLLEQLKRLSFTG